MVIGRADLIAGAAEIVAKLFRDIIPDLLLAVSCPGKENGGGCGPMSLS